MSSNISSISPSNIISSKTNSSVSQLNNNPSKLVRNICYNKWESAYRYLQAMPDINETCVSESNGYKWILIRKHKDELDYNIEPYKPTNFMLNTNDIYIEQYWQNGQLIKQSIFIISI
jgi:hypothetical protein